MDSDRNLDTVKDFTSQRRLRILEIEKKCKQLCPMNFNELVSTIEYKTGLTPKKVKDYLKVLYDVKKITIENDIVSVVNNEN